MKRPITLVSLLILTAPFLFGQRRVGPTIHPPELTARGIPAGSVRPKVFVLNGDDVIPQIANGELGGGQIFFTEFSIQNITDSPADFTLDYFGPNGDPLALPALVDVNPDVTEDFIGVADTVPANGVRFSTTWPFGADVRLGYAVVTSNPPGAVVVTALYNNLVPGSPLFQASIPMTTRNHDRLFSVYNNRFGQRSSLALVSLTEQLVTVNARDTNGITRCSFNRMMGAGDHFPFLVQNELPCTIEALKGGSGLSPEGTIEVVGPEGSLAAVGFVAQDEGIGAFTTIQVAGQVP
ncbi:MAG: hypothetical protein O2968_02345 [Acidobacteria bacterium]|nr:hypothetical protein [Acidobacteriota bacterium]